MTHPQPAAQGRNDTIVFRCIPVRQPIGDFYIGTIASSDLVEIAKADIRRIVEGTPRDVEEFSGIQRPLSDNRVAELTEYVTHVDASFPTSIILHIPSKYADFNEGPAAMSVRRVPDAAQIIDGQHRIAGLRDYKGPTFELNVAIFVDMDPEEQALLFATINLKQTKVGKSLAYDLFDFARSRSPQKTAHNIARLLNATQGSPFYHRIKILGRATAGRDETLTQAAFVDRLLPLITANAAADRDTIKRGKSLPAATAAEQHRMIFRERFRLENDAEIAKTIWNFFEAVATRWPRAWGEVRQGHVLNRTTGFAALVRLVPDAYNLLGGPEAVWDVGEVLPLLQRVTLGDDDFTRERYLPGTTGEGKLYEELSAGIRGAAR